MYVYIYMCVCMGEYMRLFIYLVIYLWLIKLHKKSPMPWADPAPWAAEEGEILPLCPVQVRGWHKMIFKVHDDPKPSLRLSENTTFTHVHSVFMGHRDVGLVVDAECGG